MSASRSLHLVFVRLLASFLALFSLTPVFVLGFPAAHRVSAQEASDLTFTLTSSATKAKVGDFVGVTVRVENTGADTIPSLSVFLNLPDALDARSISCPGDTSGTTVFCKIGDFAPGSAAEVFFAVEVSHKEPNGPMTAYASSFDVVIASASVPPLKIVGPKKSLAPADL